jgi:hypothetical protein
MSPPSGKLGQLDDDANHRGRRQLRQDAPRRSAYFRPGASLSGRIQTSLPARGRQSDFAAAWNPRRGRGDEAQGPGRVRALLAFADDDAPGRPPATRAGDRRAWLGHRPMRQPSACRATGRIFCQLACSNVAPIRPGRRVHCGIPKCGRVCGQTGVPAQPRHPRLWRTSARRLWACRCVPGSGRSSRGTGPPASGRRPPQSPPCRNRRGNAAAPGRRRRLRRSSWRGGRRGPGNAPTNRLPDFLASGSFESRSSRGVITRPLSICSTRG